MSSIRGCADQQSLENTAADGRGSGMPALDPGLGLLEPAHLVFIDGVLQRRTERKK